MLFVLAVLTSHIAYSSCSSVRDIHKLAPAWKSSADIFVISVISVISATFCICGGIFFYKTVKVWNHCFGSRTLSSTPYNGHLFHWENIRAEVNGCFGLAWWKEWGNEVKWRNKSNERLKYSGEKASVNMTRLQEKPNLSLLQTIVRGRRRAGTWQKQVFKRRGWGVFTKI